MEDRWRFPGRTSRVGTLAGESSARRRHTSRQSRAARPPTPAALTGTEPTGPGRIPGRPAGMIAAIERPQQSRPVTQRLRVADRITEGLTQQIQALEVPACGYDLPAGAEPFGPDQALC